MNDLGQTAAGYFPDSASGCKQHLKVKSRPVNWLLIPLLLLTALANAAQTMVNTSAELDFRLLEQLLIQQLFNQPGQSADLINDPSGCSRVRLSHPRVAAQGPNLAVSSKVEARLGIGIGGRCTNLLHWFGGAEFLGRPVIGADATSVEIEPVDSWLLTAGGERVSTGRVWQLAGDRLDPLFSRFRLDLAANIKALGEFLPHVLVKRTQSQLKSVVDSLALEDLSVLPDYLRITLGFRITPIEQQLPPEPPLTEAELQLWEARWQMMDSLLTFAVKHYAAATRDAELRDILIELLLDSRYRLRDALLSPASRSNDPVRRWFLHSWQQLRPVIRRIALEQTGQEHLLWVGLLSATDALEALDKLGPGIGLDISVDGLRRLARLISSQAGADVLNYSPAVDPALQQLFLQPPLPAAQPVPERQIPPSGILLDLWPIRSAQAATPAERLQRWAPSKQQLDDYLPLVAELLNQTSDRVLQEKQLETSIATLFRELVLATAWQESCWRQYVIEQKKLQPLRSGTGDVGMMQINEKVWRGFYELQKLRWDIAYNSRTGAEILRNYLLRYALEKGEHRRTGGLDNLARAAYSAYNGGPGQVARYRNPAAAASQRKVDQAFWDKYRQVKAGKAFNVAKCLGGKVPVKTSPAKQLPVRNPGSGTATGRRPPKKPALAGERENGGERWARSQPAANYTLQLAVFSQRQSADRFIQQEKLSGALGVIPVGKGKAVQYAVLYGSYPNRIDADRSKSRLKHLQPWVRRFADLLQKGKQ